jgi:aspartate carbamoyltransferase regulatory subunit
LTGGGGTFLAKQKHLKRKPSLPHRILCHAKLHAKRCVSATAKQVLSALAPTDDGYAHVSCHLCGTRALAHRCSVRVAGTRPAGHHAQ